VRLLDRDRATPQAVREALPLVRQAHLATHGFFNHKDFEAECLRRRQYLDALSRGTLSADQRPGLRARNPLSYVGLRLAGSETPEQVGPDRGILSGEAILELPLDNLRLCVLSACETGLGAVRDRGEGVSGLVRTFHLAGCHNVVGSLWRVNDQATEALMGLFYARLLQENKEPLQALREAQLYLYRHPEQVPDLARRRGFDWKPVPLPPARPKGAATARTEDWAAFFLSGPGR
jgi:CHAT domain-containing protein